VGGEQSTTQVDKGRGEDPTPGRIDQSLTRGKPGVGRSSAWFEIREILVNACLRGLKRWGEIRRKRDRVDSA